MPLKENEYLQINQALFSLVHAYESRMQAEDEKSRGGLTMVDCSVLMVVGQFQPLNARRLSELMDINPGTISVYVQQLVEKGMLKRRQDQEDRRNWWLTLSRMGGIAYKQIIAGTVAYTQDFLSPLDADEQAQLHSLLLKAAHGLGFDWE